MNRGQAYTLEGVVAAIVVVIAIGYGLQAVDTGPWTGERGTSTEPLEQRAEDVLALGADTGALSSVVRCYGFNKPVIDGATDTANLAVFEGMLNRTFDSRGTEYNLYISYWDGTKGRKEILVSSNNTAFPEPDPDAVSASRQLALYDDMPVRFNAGGTDCSSNGPPISQLNNFYIPDVNESSPVYNVVEVRLVVW